MTVGEVIAELCKYCSEDLLLMVRGVTDIEVRGDTITVYFEDRNVEDAVIERY